MKDYSAIRKTPLLRLLMPYIAGVLLANAFHESLPNEITFLSIAICGLLFLIVYYYKFKKSVLFNLLVIPVFTSLAMGFTIICVKVPTNFENEVIWNGIIYEKPLLKNNSILLPIKLSPKEFKTNGIFRSQKLWLYTTKDISMFDSITIGDAVFFKGKLDRIKNYGNPDEFDYAGFMLQKGIAFQTFIPKENILIVPQNKLIFKKLITGIHEKGIEIIRAQINNTDAFAIVSALTLGEKTYLSDELKQNYANAGAIHILAVSGLHVGIIYLFINFLFGFSSNFYRLGKYKILVTILIIWLYAFLTGLSPSVSRAALMFSFFSLAEGLKRDVSYFNILGGTALLLLLVNPLLLYNVGFQLSFLAVGGIVYFQPLLFKLMSTSYSASNYVIKLFSLTLAAQLVTAPLTIYYFNQFPTYFWLTNIIVVPFVGITLASSLLFMLLSFIPVLSNLLSSMTEFILIAINKSIALVNDFPFAVINSIHLSLPSLLIVYSIIISITLWIRFRRASYFIVSLCLFFTGLSITVYNQATQVQSSEIVFYSHPQGVYIGICDKDKSALLIKNRSEDSNQFLTHYLNKHWRKNNKHGETTVFNLDSTYYNTPNQLNKFRFDSLQSLVIYDKPVYKMSDKSGITYFCVTENVWPPKWKVNAERIIIQNQVSTLISEKWHDYARLHNIAIYDIEKTGALIFSFNQ
jgi:competence protein ComEC